jgi:2-methylisocitrate lyase-like PEP mutase family enzyme
LSQNQKQKAEAFRKLHFGLKAFVIPNPWDAGSARLLETLGFQALATTSAGLAFSKGKPDGESKVSRNEAIANAREIVEATGLPVAADLEGGYGPKPEDCALTIRRAGEAGLVGGSIEDSSGDSNAPVYPIEAAVERVRAAVEAARALDFPFILTARAENFLHGRADLANTIKRLQAYQRAGADVLFAPGLKTAEDIRTVCSSVDRPVNVVMGLVGVPLSVDQLSELGVKRISTGGSLARAALSGFMRAAEEIRDAGTFTYAVGALPHAKLNALFSGRG